MRLGNDRHDKIQSTLSLRHARGKVEIFAKIILLAEEPKIDFFHEKAEWPGISDNRASRARFDGYLQRSAGVQWNPKVNLLTNHPAIPWLGA